MVLTFHLETDPIVAEVRQAREALFAEANYDIHELCRRAPARPRAKTPGTSVSWTERSPWRITMRICIDPGHGGADPGAIGTSPTQNLEEKTFNLRVSLLLRGELADAGHTVIMTRQDDVFVRLEDRATVANQADADLFVSIHANAAANPEPEGMEVFCFPGSVRGREAAGRVLDSILAEFSDHRNRGVKEANFAVLRLSGMPAILVECEFLTNPRQLEFLADADNQRRLAAAIARAVQPD